MATYKFVGDPGAGVPTFTQTGTWGTAAGQAPPVQFGHKAVAFDPTFGYAEFIFVKGSTNAAGELLQLVSNNNQARRAGSGTASAGPVGFAPAAMSATNVWGWVQVYGVFDSAIHSAACANGAAIKMGTSAGHINAQTASNDTHQIGGMFNAGSNTASNNGSVHCFYPFYKGY